LCRFRGRLQRIGNRNRGCLCCLGQSSTNQRDIHALGPRPDQIAISRIPIHWAHVKNEQSNHGKRSPLTVCEEYRLLRRHVPSALPKGISNPSFSLEQVVTRLSANVDAHKCSIINCLIRKPIEPEPSALPREHGQAHMPPSAALAQSFSPSARWIRALKMHLRSLPPRCSRARRTPEPQSNGDLSRAPDR
jgi:hypothetical protein